MTNILLSPVSRADKTISGSVMISGAEEISELTRSLHSSSPWQNLVPGSSGHWFSDRRLKLTLERHGGESLALWVEFSMASPKTVARFDRLPDLSTDKVLVPMSDAASAKLGAALLRIIQSHGVTWNKAPR